MDGLMGKLGLSGKAFLPMVLGFGCTVPAVMASRALEKEKDRKKTILVTPFMSCSARLPIYVLFSEMFFPGCAYVVAFSMYVLGMVMAILVAPVSYTHLPVPEALFQWKIIHIFCRFGTDYLYQFEKG